jgi:type IV pilus assembly protein PilC
LILAAIFIPSIKILLFEGPIPYLRGTIGVFLPFLVALGVLYVIVRFLFQSPGFRAFYDQVKLSLPVVGALVRKLTVGKLTRALAALHAAGLSLPTSLRQAGAVCGNAQFAQSLERVAPMLERGEPLSTAMASTGLFSPMVLGMVQTGEHSGEMENMLNKVADYQESEAQHATNQLITVMGVLVFLMIAVYIASIVLSFWGGYGAAIQQAGSG